MEKPARDWFIKHTSFFGLIPLLEDTMLVQEPVINNDFPGRLGLNLKLLFSDIVGCKITSPLHKHAISPKLTMLKLAFITINVKWTHCHSVVLMCWGWLGVTWFYGYKESTEARYTRSCRIWAAFAFRNRCIHVHTTSPNKNRAVLLQGMRFTDHRGQNLHTVGPLSTEQWAAKQKESIGWDAFYLHNAANAGERHLVTADTIALQQHMRAERCFGCPLI